MKQLRILFLLLMVTCGNFAWSTSPCRVKTGCVDEASAALVAPIDAMEQHCMEIDAPHGADYRVVARRLLEDDGSDFLDRLRASTVYAVVRREVDEEMAEMTHDALQKACTDFLR